ncbi:c-type cytochrome [Sandarakinorhabdus sp. DWP1-3-1]|uniref:c-type cytochrome n=1 Tax=Sandarakinorhabdus sp. DWP1-3-1 TaxID=2804627 RepID=UPI003CF189C8
MDSYEFNKYAGWGLAAVIAVLGVSIVSHEMFLPEKPEKPSYVVEGVVAEVSADAAPAVAEKPIAFYLASASPDKGEAVFKKCGACHNAEKGGANGIGPNLYGIVGNTHAHVAGFAYSEALTAMKGKPWSWDELSAWLANPKGYAPGTKMAFAGIAKPEDRAALLLYLNSKSDAPQPVPAAPAETAAAPTEAAAPAADAAAPAADATAPAAAPAQ